MAGACGGGDADQPQPVDATAAATQPESDQSGTAGSGSGDDATGEGQATGDSAMVAEDAAQEPGADDGRLVAPVDTTTTAPASTEPVPQSGGTLRVAVEAESDGLNPAANNLAVPGYAMAYPMFDPLAYFDAEGNWIPYLAESFTRIDDGAVWHMKLREGVRFHDGTELDADDVIATVTAQLADPVLSLVYRNTIDADQFIRKLDRYTLELRLANPSARFPLAFTGQLGMVLPSEWLERAAADPVLNQTPVGQGPFMIESRI